MRRVLPQLIVVAAGGLAFGMVYRCFLDDPSEASVAVLSTSCAPCADRARATAT